MNVRTLRQAGRLENLTSEMDKYELNVVVRINLPLFSTVVPASIFMFLSCMPFVAIAT